MTNKKMWDNSNLQEDIKWGNVELPGLSDEELYTKNWNYVDAAKRRVSNSITREKMILANRKSAQDPTAHKNRTEANRKKAQDPEWQKNQKEAIVKRWSDPEERRKHKERHNTPEYLEYIKKRNKEIANRPENLQRYKEFNQAKRQDPEHIKRHQAAIDKRTQDPNWIAHQQSRRKRIQTPDGIFESRSKAAEFYKVKPPVINGRIKKYPTEYFYLK